MIVFKKWYVLFMYGQGGWLFDQISSNDGSGRLGAKIDALSPDITVKMTTYDSFFASARPIKALPEDVGVILLGTSLGACNLGWMALAIWRRPVEYAAGIQPSIWGQRNDIPENVKECLCIYNPYNPITFGLGARKLVATAGNTTTKMRYMNTWRPHPGDGYPEIHDQIIADIRRVTRL